MNLYNVHIASFLHGSFSFIRSILFRYLEFLEELAAHPDDEVPLSDLLLAMTKDQMLGVALHYRHFSVIPRILKARPSLAYSTDKGDNNNM